LMAVILYAISIIFFGNWMQQF